MTPPNEVTFNVEPLKGKHYGTLIRVTPPESLTHRYGPRTFSITVWAAFGAPSDEMLSYHWDLDRAEWDANIEVDDGWDGTAGCQDVYGPFDNHYQSQFEAALAEHIADCINGWTWEK